MNTEFKCLATAVFLFVCSPAFSQSDTNFTYYVSDVTIDYSSGIEEVINSETGKILMLSDSRSVQEINKIKFENDSIIRIFIEEKPDVFIKINDIEQITFNNGTSTGKIMGGIGIGAIMGLAVGALISGLQKEEKPTSAEPNPFAGLKNLEKISYYGYGLLIGAVTGGIIGSLITDYKTYDMKKFRFDKKKGA